MVVVDRVVHVKMAPVWIGAVSVPWMRHIAGLSRTNELVSIVVESLFSISVASRVCHSCTC